MTVIIQLSDLHLLQDPDEQVTILDALVTALAHERARRGQVDLLAITGDLFDSATVDPKAATRAFDHLHGRILEALGGPVPAVVVPGNHDRRRAGLFGPHRQDLIVQLARATRDRGVWVHGCDTPFLSGVVPESFHQLPMWVLVYDSSYLPTGYISAGGMLRQEDLVKVACEMGDRYPERPVLFLLHHHLVPTPLTDLGPIEAESQHPVVRWGVEQVLPRLVSHGDREELMMTALGAGTALSTLHTLGRAVLVLHGHKHYATARVLDATFQDHGDVLLVSAGSCGTAQAWSPVQGRDSARLWPSFNVIILRDDELTVETASFGWKGSSTGEIVYRPLVSATRQRSQWVTRPISPSVEPEPARLSLNSSEVRLRVSQEHQGRRFDLVCHREVSPKPGNAPSRYIESVEAERGAQLRWVDRPGEGDGAPELPTLLQVPVGGTLRYEVGGAVSRSLDERRADESPFAWIGLMNRYASDVCRLEVHGLDGSEPFASATDLGTGLERPLTLKPVEGGGVVARYEHCPPRTLLRIYWPLLR